MLPATSEQRRPLIARRGHPTVFAVIGVAVAAFAAMALWVHDTRNPTGVDHAVYVWSREHLGVHVREILLALTEPVLTVGTAAVVALVAARLRRWDVAALAALGPALAVLLSTFVFKPWIGRLFGLGEEASYGLLKAGYAFPSGHETGLASVATLLAVLVLRSRLATRVKAAGTISLAIWTVLGAAGLVRATYHYATDTVGGVLLGVVVVLGLALLIDSGSDRVSSPAARSRSRTSRGA